MIRNLLIAILAIVAIVQGCVLKDAEGNTYDLTKWSATDTKAESGGIQFTFRFCGVVSEEECRIKKGSVCRYNGDKYTSLFSIWDKSPTVVPNADGIPSFSFKNGDPVNGHSYTTQWALKCTQDSSDNVSFDVDYAKNLFLFILSSPQVCPNLSGGDGLSGGWVFIIILLSVTVVYIALGLTIAVMVQKKPVSVTSIPGIGFFAALFSYSIAGVKHTFAALKKMSSKNGGDYSEVGDAV